MTLVRAVHWTMEKTRLQQVSKWKGGEEVEVSAATFSRSFAFKKMEKRGMWVWKGMSECMHCCFHYFLDVKYLNLFMLMERNREGEVDAETGRLMKRGSWDGDWQRDCLRVGDSSSCDEKEGEAAEVEMQGGPEDLIWWQKVEGIPHRGWLYLLYE